jgi:hypothetical protein
MNASPGGLLSDPGDIDVEDDIQLTEKEMCGVVSRLKDYLDQKGAWGEVIYGCG